MSFDEKVWAFSLSFYIKKKTRRKKEVQHSYCQQKYLITRDMELNFMEWNTNDAFTKGWVIKQVTNLHHQKYNSNSGALIIDKTGFKNRWVNISVNVQNILNSILYHSLSRIYWLDLLQRRKTPLKKNVLIWH